MNDLVLYNADIIDLNNILTDFIRNSKVDCAIVSSSEGHLVTYQGLTAMLDTTAMAALVTGSFSASGCIARLFGEKEFQTMFHKGKNFTFHISLLNKDFYLTSIFSNQIAVDEVNRHVTWCVHKLDDFFRRIQSNEETAFLPELDTKLIFFERKNSDGSPKSSSRKEERKRATAPNQAIADEAIGGPAPALRLAPKQESSPRPSVSEIEPKVKAE
jgi:predicted regulator of Ras-like GTPase activity (Roadblock/LC7/MglB family)